MLLSVYVRSFDLFWSLPSMSDGNMDLSLVLRAPLAREEKIFDPTSMKANKQATEFEKSSHSALGC